MFGAKITQITYWNKINLMISLISNVGAVSGNRQRTRAMAKATMSAHIVICVGNSLMHRHASGNVIASWTTIGHLTRNARGRRPT